MAMSVSSAGSGEPMVDMNTTPLIDVMLVLLIMFIITLPVMTNNIDLDLPQGPGSTAAREAINLFIDYDGTIVWNGATVSNLEQLEQYFRAEAGKPNQAELHVRPDKRAKYDDVAQVLGMAQRHGIQRIGFAGQEQYLP
ncbi:biopolymer transporter ExbD [Steroidobacter sp. S1-65]|uniref:Biopolymer transporter ExbD n=1 Tax=Steroidobacter gossypii TaxID=2805490 RepID=A0ABS1WYK5_9GAMM|nr:biopolymer transporter ExbD [Steroidobacter gossypii]MBM0106058.1 biopolymer transporter ExbD [Steroidobacter gossypii]